MELRLCIRLMNVIYLKMNFKEIILSENMEQANNLPVLNKGKKCLYDALELERVFFWVFGTAKGVLRCAEYLFLYLKSLIFSLLFWNTYTKYLVIPDLVWFSTPPLIYIIYKGCAESCVPYHTVLI